MRFLFCSLDSLGTLFPSMGLALALEERGHEVAFVTSLAREEVLAACGLRRIEREAAADGPSFLVRRWAEPVEIALQVKHIEHALSVFSADVLVGQQLTFGPLIAAERRAIPLAMIGYASYLWPSGSENSAESGEGEGGADARAERRDRLEWRYRDMLGHLNRARALFRLPPLDLRWAASPMLGDLFLLRTIPSLEPDWLDLPARVHLAGDCLWEPEGPADAALESWLERAEQSGRPLVYLHHGQFFGDPIFLAALVEAARQLDLWVAASVGRMGEPFGVLPERFFVRDHVPQQAVLPRAAAVVASGHSTAALGALLAGLPSLLVCSGGEQPEIGFRWREAGVSRILRPEEATPATLCAGIEEVLSDRQMRRRAQAEQRNLREWPRRAAVDLLERLARERRPVLREGAMETFLMAEPARLS
jgi:UDP:flavonoid glycosyltransferase YjiC (YdhE family)